MPLERTLERLALEKDLIEAAKETVGGDFRTSLDVAVRKNLRRIEWHLEQAGITKAESGTAYRMRPVTIQTMAELEAVKERTGLSLPILMRGCLRLVVTDPKNDHLNLENLIGLA